MRKTILTRLGSPPLTWRKQRYKRSELIEFGITPTYVEKTRDRLVLLLAIQDHLHIRGENSLSLSYIGSPPHTWRKHMEKISNAVSDRITSTYVEKTKCFSTFKLFHEDHLHIRGENYLQHRRKCCLLGSPPHTWRKLPFFACKKSLIGITSTYVEKTFSVNSK